MTNIQEVISAVRAGEIKGFLHESEAVCLFRYCTKLNALGSALEIGSYCGKSTVFMGQAYREGGSEEHQQGQQYHDPELWDTQLSGVNTFSYFRQTINQFNLDDIVMPIVAPSKVVAKNWCMPLALVFVDGGHSEAAADHDVLAWSRFIEPGGALVIHDIYKNETEGGQAPKNAMLKLLAQGCFYLERKVGSLVVLRRKAPKRYNRMGAS